jgi:uncharacterized membrane protein YraQ (UPF0718 family)
MYVLWALAGVGLAVSLIVDRGKTLTALKRSAKRFVSILGPLLLMLVALALLLYLLPAESISEYLTNRNTLVGVLSGLLLGSVAMLPGFIAFPLGGLLRQGGVPYMVIAAFTTTLMMVGILTFPIERKVFGARVALARNAISFAIAVIVSVATGLYFGELL